MHVIRRASPEDQDALQSLYSAALADADWLPTSSRIASPIKAATQDEEVFVCCDPEGSILGFLSVYKPGAFIHHLYVARISQNQGIGSALLQSLNSWLAKPWALKCVKANTGAIAFYLSKGWHEVEASEGPDGKYLLLRTSEA